MDEWQKKKEQKIRKFFYYNNFWCWSILTSIVFVCTYYICNQFNYYFVDRDFANILISGHLSFIGFVLTVGAFVFSSKAGIGLMKNKPHGRTFFWVLCMTILYSLVAIIGYMFYREPLIVYIPTTASLTNIIVSFYYLYFTLKNFAENPDATA